MSAIDERRLEQWILEGPSHGPADGLERALVAAVGVRQRPAWLVPGWWRPASLERVPVQTLRLAIAVAALLAAALMSLFIRAGLQPPSAEELVRRSMAAHADPPPFSMTTTSLIGTLESGAGVGCFDQLAPEPADTTFRFEFDASGAFSEACLDRNGRLYELTVENGEEAGRWAEGRWIVLPDGVERPAGVPVGTVPWLNWLQYGELLDGKIRPAGRPESCDAWTPGRQGAVAGRPATEVRCGERGFWIDDETSLLVRLDAGAAGTIEALRLEIGQPSGNRFAIAPPRNARGAIEPGLGTRDWTLPLVEGGRLDWSSFVGMPVVVLTLQAPRAPFPSVADFAAGIEGSRGRIQALIVADVSDHFRLTREELDVAAAAGIPVVVDDGSALSGWAHRPGVSIFDAAGTTRYSEALRSPESIRAAIDAYLEGMPIPLPPLGDGAFRVGQPAPPFETVLLDETPFDLESLRGRPVVVLSPAYESLDDPASVDAVTSMVSKLARTRGLVGDRATFVVIAWGVGYGGAPAPQWPAVVAAVRSGVGGAADDLLFVEGRTYGGSDWTDLAWVGGNSEVWESALVVLDADLRVARLLIDPLPEPDELARMVEAVIAQSP